MQSAVGKTTDNTKLFCWQNQMKWSTEGHKSTACQSRIKNTTCLPHRLCNPHEPERDGFQHVKILREYWKKWHAVGGYMIFWFTKVFCKLPQTFHGESMKITMPIHTLLGIFKSLNKQMQAVHLLISWALKWTSNSENTKHIILLEQFVSSENSEHKGLKVYFNFH